MCKEIALKGYFQGVRKIAQVAGKTAQVWKEIAQVGSKENCSAPSENRSGR